MKSIHLRAALALAILLGVLILFVGTHPASNPGTISEPLGNFDPETRSLIALHTEVAQLLIEAGADVNIRNSENFYGKTALFLAEYGGHNKIAALLKQKGATLEGSIASKI